VCLFVSSKSSSLADSAFAWCCRYVTYTSREEEHNLVVFQFNRHIYYRVSQSISEGAELKVLIGKEYASLLGLGMGEFSPSGLQSCD